MFQGGIYGENLASGYENVTSAIIAWGEERRKYEFRGGSFQYVHSLNQLLTSFPHLTLYPLPPPLFNYLRTQC
jgi:hypothetical protein